MNIRVLLVDDEKEFVNSLAERLRIRDVDVSVAFSGEDALGQLDEFNFDVVILDVNMPGISGIDTLKEIKKKNPITEVLMLTGQGTIDTAIEGMKQGAFDFLIKPCEIDKLMEKIKSAYERKSGQDEKIKEALADKLSTSPLSVFE